MGKFRQWAEKEGLSESEKSVALLGWQAALESKKVDPSWSLIDRVEFALRDAGFDLDEAFTIAHKAAQQATQTAIGYANLHHLKDTSTDGVILRKKSEFFTVPVYAEPVEYPKCVVCGEFPVFDAGDVCAPCAHKASTDFTPGQRLARQLIESDAASYVGAVYDTEKGDIIVSAQYADNVVPVLSDDQCIAIYEAVRRSGITRDVKSAEQQCSIVRNALTEKKA